MVRLGIIGRGGMAGVFLYGVQALPDRLRFDALVDTGAERPRQAAERAPETVHAAAYRDILDVAGNSTSSPTARWKEHVPGDPARRWMHVHRAINTPQSSQH